MVAMVRLKNGILSRMESSAGVYSGKSGGESMKRPQKLAVMLVPTPPYEICGLITPFMVSARLALFTSTSFVAPSDGMMLVIKKTAVRKQPMIDISFEFLRISLFVFMVVSGSGSWLWVVPIKK